MTLGGAVLVYPQANNKVLSLGAVIISYKALCPPLRIYEESLVGGA